jgi:hypothetical protein
VLLPLLLLFLSILAFSMIIVASFNSLILQLWILTHLATTAHSESICTDCSLFVTCLINTRLSNPDTVLKLLLEHDPQMIVGMVFGLVACV